MTQTVLDTDTRQIVVLERQPYWQPELARQFLHKDFTVRGCRTLDDLDELTRENFNAIAVVDLSVGPADVLRWLARRLTYGPPAPTIVIASDEWQSIEWHTREAGAVAVVSEFLGGHRLARLCRKQFT